MSVVYPVARGVAPTIVLLAGIVVLGYGTSAAQAAGVVLVGLGVLAIRGVRGDATGVVFGARDRGRDRLVHAASTSAGSTTRRRSRTSRSR